MQEYQEYLAYLETPEWWATRRRALQRAGYQCERCGSCGPLEGHHLSYDRLGCERDGDIAMVCRACHEAERLPRNLRKRELERYGQARLFDRWESP